MSLNKGSLDQALVGTIFEGLTMTDDLDLSLYNLIVNSSGNKTISPAELAKIDGLLATTAELNHMQNASSEIQAQINAITTLLTGLSQAELGTLDGVIAGLVATELNYLDGVTSAIQTQLNAKQATLGANDITGAMIEATDQLHEIDFQSTKEIGLPVIGSPIFQTAGATVLEANSGDPRFKWTNSTGAHGDYDDSIAVDLTQICNIIKALNPAKTLTITSFKTTVAQASASSINHQARTLHQNGVTDTLESAANTAKSTTAKEEITINTADVTFALGDSLTVFFSWAYNGSSFDTYLYNAKMVYTLT